MIRHQAVKKAVAKERLFVRSLSKGLDSTKSAASFGIVRGECEVFCSRWHEAGHWAEDWMTIIYG